jgi:uncharacterized protein (TIGR00297 family)
MPDDIVLLQLIAGLLLSTIIALVAFHKQALTASGAVGAILVGTTVFGFGGWPWGLVLVAFFAVSSTLSHHRSADKTMIADKFLKGSRRDLGQVLANGGLAAIVSVLYLARPTPAVLAAFLGAMATVNADTWGTEIGVLSPIAPRLLTTGRRVPAGTSGGVTWLGTSASILGALFIGLLGYLLVCIDSFAAGHSALQLSWIIPATLVSGLLGSIFDSLLGATVQGIYYCAACETETEKQLHGCGLRTSHVRGWRWLNNDVVNFVSSVAGAAVAVAIWGILAG